MKSSYSLAELEAAINYWRTRSPAKGEECSLCPQAAALAEPYALMIFNQRHDVDTSALTDTAQAALADWHQNESK